MKFPWRTLVALLRGRHRRVFGCTFWRRLRLHLARRAERRWQARIEADLIRWEAETERRRNAWRWPV